MIQEKRKILKNSFLILLLGILCSCNSGKQLFNERRRITPNQWRKNSYQASNLLEKEKEHIERDYIFIPLEEMLFESTDLEAGTSPSQSFVINFLESKPQINFKGSRPTKKLILKERNESNMQHYSALSGDGFWEIFITVVAFLCCIWFFMWILDL